MLEDLQSLQEVIQKTEIFKLRKWKNWKQSWNASASAVLLTINFIIWNFRNYFKCSFLWSLCACVWFERTALLQFLFCCCAKSKPAVPTFQGEWRVRCQHHISLALCVVASDSCPYGWSIIKDLSSLPSSLARIKFLLTLSQKWVRWILINPLKILNYRDRTRKVIQQLSLSASLWASTQCWASGAAAQDAIKCSIPDDGRNRLPQESGLRSETRCWHFAFKAARGFGNACIWECHPGQRDGLRAGQASVGGFTALLQLAVLADSAPGLQWKTWTGDHCQKRVWSLKMCSSGNLTVEACQTLHLWGTCTALQQSKWTPCTSAGKGHA